MDADGRDGVQRLATVIRYDVTTDTVMVPVPMPLLGQVHKLIQDYCEETGYSYCTSSSSTSIPSQNQEAQDDEALGPKEQLGRTGSP